jgi:tRNA threonylcarbamoyladenosine biosynthesis protein TsaB
MHVLALDTATEACSVALLVDASVDGRGGRLVEAFEIAPRRHAELVLPMVGSVLAEAGLGLAAVDAIAAGRGPGAFTGVRLAIAMAQGLALGAGRPVVTVSTLATLAQGAVGCRVGPGNRVLALIDARMGEVYVGAFIVDDDGLVLPLGNGSVCAPAAVAAPEGDVVVVGSGWEAHREAFLAQWGRAPTAEDPDALPRAGDLARLAARDFATGLAVDAGEARPVYLRDKVALTVDEQIAARAASGR